MMHFKADGALFKSVGVAGQGTSKRKVLLAGMGSFGFVFMAIIVFLLRSSGADSAIYAMVPIFALSFGFSILVISKTMGGGGLTVNTSTGEVSFRKASSFGFSSTKLQRSDIQELVLHSYTYNHGRNTSYRILFSTSMGDFVPAVFSFTDLNTARETGTELASLISVTLREDITDQL